MTINDIIEIVLTDPRTPYFQQENSDLYSTDYLYKLNNCNKGTSENNSSSPTGRAAFPLESSEQLIKSKIKNTAYESLQVV